MAAEGSRRCRSSEEGKVPWREPWRRNGSLRRIGRPTEQNGDLSSERECIGASTVHYVRTSWVNHADNAVVPRRATGAGHPHPLPRVTQSPSSAEMSHGLFLHDKRWSSGRATPPKKIIRRRRIRQNFPWQLLEPKLCLFAVFIQYVPKVRNKIHETFVMYLFANYHCEDASKGFTYDVPVHKGQCLWPLRVSKSYGVGSLNFDVKCQNINKLKKNRLSL